MNIGIGITTHNRNELVANTFHNIQSLTPGAKLVVVDDFSVEPVKIEGAEVFRFEENVGIARAKNKCLELLEGCDHIFLFDDDTWPLVEDWWKPYIESPEPHLMYSFSHWANGNPVGDDKIVYQDERIEAHVAARGCMIYLRDEVIKKVGGFDTKYGKAMHEHIDLSNRIFNAGLTSFRFMDVTKKGLIYSSDEHKSVASSIVRTERYSELQKNLRYYELQKNSSRYVEYRDRKKVKKGTNIVLTTYFTSEIDVQRGMKWDPNPAEVAELCESVAQNGEKLVVLNDCFPESSVMEHVSGIGNPYFIRWYAQYRWLKEHPEIDNVFCVDATDVKMLNSPFNDMAEGILYVGDELSHLSNRWLLSNSPQIKMKSFFIQNRTLQLLNCGVVGGSREDVMELCRKMYALCSDDMRETVDMPAFNYLMYTQYSHKIHHGRDVTNVFKSFKPNDKEWFTHK